MVQGGNFTFQVVEEKPQRQKATITIGREHINALYNEVLHSQKEQSQTYGFSKGSTPLQYIEQNFRSNIVEHLKELLFTHCVVNFLYESLYTNKIVLAGDPDLVDIQLQPEGDAQFVFSLVNIEFEKDKRWKRLLLNAPERKNYKDLDRQVEAFIKEELERKSTTSCETIAINDWVFFEVALLDKSKQALMQDYKSHLWIRIQGEEDDQELRDLFVGKKAGDSFFTQSAFLQEYMSLSSEMEYTFLVEIRDFVPHAYFDFDLFMYHFNIKDKEKIPAKLVEVFSTRNDISLRREIMEAMLKLLCKHYFFGVPPHLLERQRLMVLQAVQVNPDYHVYKSQLDFKEKIRQLAEKQLKEATILDAIAYQEGIEITHKDIRSYLNFLQRPRTKEFVYFTPPAHKILGQEVPLTCELVKRYCLREKTLNYLIQELTKK